MRLLPRSFFESEATVVARNLLGKIVRKGACEGIIVEVEAYAGDAASHAMQKPNQGRPMRETYGEWYVYFTYGMHYCANVTCHKGGVGGVLIRAVEPTKGLELMRKRREVSDLTLLKLTTGPANFAKAFGIDRKNTGSTPNKEFGIFDAPQVPDERVGISPRIGIRHDVELPWRFFIKDNPFVSKKKASAKTT